MRKENVTGYRVRRFAELLASAFDGNKAAMGRALGWKNGAIVWQILDGRRPVTEKLIERIDSIQGGKYAGWFGGRDQNDEEASREINNMTSNATGWPLGDLITQERWASLDPAIRAAAISAVEQTVMQSLIGPKGASSKRHSA